MDPNTMLLAAAIRASIQLAAEQDSSVPMAKRMDFKTAFRTAYKDLHLAVDEIQDERPGIFAALMASRPKKEGPGRSQPTQPSCVRAGED
jgi:hypothetical protein